MVSSYDRNSKTCVCVFFSSYILALLCLSFGLLILFIPETFVAVIMLSTLA